jgi:hypothetical protein
VSVDTLRRFAVGGAQRPDSFSGLNPNFSAALSQFFAAAPPEVQAQMRIASGYRSPQIQAGLWEQALRKYGSPEKARKWVAPPGRSQHNHGHAVDLKYLAPAAMQWAHANAGKYGLSFPLKHETWHIEYAGARGAQPATSNPPTPTAMPTQYTAAASVSPGQAAPSLGFGGTLASMFAGAPVVPDFGVEMEQQRLRERARREALFSGPLV